MKQNTEKCDALACSCRCSDWPVLTSYDQQHLERIALPLGGIGTGTVSLGGCGQLRDWELMNRPAKGFSPRNAFFALYARPAGGSAVTRALEGALLPPYEGAMGSTAANHGLPRFRSCIFEAAYPFGQVRLSDPDVPVDVRIEAFNPLIPADPEASGIPMALLRFVLKNKTAKIVEAAVCGSLENFIGTDGTNGKPCMNINEFRTGADGWKGVFMRSLGVDPQSEWSGTLALATDATDVSWRTAWPNLTWGDALLDFWDDFSSDGRLEEREAPGVHAPMASLAASVRLSPHATRAVTFLLAWRFPNRMTWFPTPVTTGTEGGMPRALTLFVNATRVSRFLPADPDLAHWDYHRDTPIHLYF